MTHRCFPAPARGVMLRISATADLSATTALLPEQVDRGATCDEFEAFLRRRRLRHVREPLCRGCATVWV